MAISPCSAALIRSASDMAPGLPLLPGAGADMVTLDMMTFLHKREPETRLARHRRIETARAPGLLPAPELCRLGTSPNRQQFANDVARIIRRFSAPIVPEFAGRSTVKLVRQLAERERIEAIDVARARIPQGTAGARPAVPA